MASNPLSSATSHFPALRRKSISKAADAEAKLKRDTAVREAKEHMRDVVRADWTFDPPSTLWSSSSLPAAIPTPLSTIQSGTDMRANVVQWRTREPGSSDSDSELDAYIRRNTTAYSAVKKDTNDPYRFDSPDAIKSSILERGRRRRADLEREMKWNPGLRFFTERRDAWTGARKRRSVVGAQRRRASSLSEEGGMASLSRNGDIVRTSESDSRAKASSSEETSSPVGLPRDLLEVMTLSAEKSRDTTTTTLEDKDGFNEYDLDGEDDPDEDNDYDGGDRDSGICNYDSDDSVVPVMEPFLPETNYVRSSITPAIYASLYSKVIVQGLTPTIPINLSDVTKALVAGWKADGQWPPKPNVPPPGSDVPARRKGKETSPSKNDTITADGVLVGGPEQACPSSSTTTAAASRRKSSFSNQATNAVKKVLALSSHPFHIRRSSRGGDVAEGTATSAMTRRLSGAVEGDVPLVEE